MQNFTGRAMARELQKLDSEETEQGSLHRQARRGVQWSCSKIEGIAYSGLKYILLESGQCRGRDQKNVTGNTGKLLKSIPIPDY